MSDILKASSGKLLMIYLSMHDCPGCLEFTPLLVELYNELNENGKVFEVVFMSGDKQEDVFRGYWADMPWPALPFKDRRMKQVIKRFGIKGLPRLIVMNAKTYEVLHADAVDVVTEQGPVIIE